MEERERGGKGRRLNSRGREGGEGREDEGRAPQYFALERPVRRTDCQWVGISDSGHEPTATDRASDVSLRYIAMCRTSSCVIRARQCHYRARQHVSSTCRHSLCVCPSVAYTRLCSSAVMPSVL